MMKKGLSILKVWKFLLKLIIINIKLVIKKAPKNCILNNLKKRYFSKNIFCLKSSIKNPDLSKKSNSEKKILIKVGDEITRNEIIYRKILLVFFLNFFIIPNLNKYNKENAINNCSITK